MNPNFLRKSEVIFHEGSRVVELQVDGYNPRSFRTSDLTQCFPEITLLTVLSSTPVEQKKAEGIDYQLKRSKTKPKRLQESRDALVGKASKRKSYDWILRLRGPSSAVAVLAERFQKPEEEADEDDEDEGDSLDLLLGGFRFTITLKKCFPVDIPVLGPFRAVGGQNRVESVFRQGPLANKAKPVNWKIARLGPSHRKGESKDLAAETSIRSKLTLHDALRAFGVVGVTPRDRMNYSRPCAFAGTSLAALEAAFEVECAADFATWVKREGEFAVEAKCWSELFARELCIAAQRKREALRPLLAQQQQRQQAQAQAQVQTQAQSSAAQVITTVATIAAAETAERATKDTPATAKPTRSTRPARAKVPYAEDPLVSLAGLRRLWKRLEGVKEGDSFTSLWWLSANPAAEVGLDDDEGKEKGEEEKENDEFDDRFLLDDFDELFDDDSYGSDDYSDSDDSYGSRRSHDSYDSYDSYRRNDRHDRYDRNDRYDRYDQYDRNDRYGRYHQNDRYDRYGRKDRYERRDRYRGSRYRNSRAHGEEKGESKGGDERDIYDFRRFQDRQVINHTSRMEDSMKQAQQHRLRKDQRRDRRRKLEARRKVLRSILKMTDPGKQPNKSYKRNKTKSKRGNESESESGSDSQSLSAAANDPATSSKEAWIKAAWAESEAAEAGGQTNTTILSASSQATSQAEVEHHRVPTTGMLARTLKNMHKRYEGPRLDTDTLAHLKNVIEPVEVLEDMEVSAEAPTLARPSTSVPKKKSKSKSELLTWGTSSADLPSKKVRKRWEAMVLQATSAATPLFSFATVLLLRLRLELTTLETDVHEFGAADSVAGYVEADDGGGPELGGMIGSIDVVEEPAAKAEPEEKSTDPPVNKQDRDGSKEEGRQEEKENSIVKKIEEGQQEELEEKKEEEKEPQGAADDRDYFFQLKYRRSVLLLCLTKSGEKIWGRALVEGKGPHELAFEAQGTWFDRSGEIELFLSEGTYDPHFKRSEKPIKYATIQIDMQWTEDDTEFVGTALGSDGWRALRVTSIAPREGLLPVPMPRSRGSTDEVDKQEEKDETAETKDTAKNSDFCTTQKALETARGDPTTAMMDVALVDAEWLMNWKDPPPCRQGLPNEALFHGSVDAKDVVVLGISYPWLTKEHPDPEGWHLDIVQHFLRLYFTLENNGKDNYKKSITHPPTGQGKRVAIFWDWMSLFQANHPGGQTEDEKASFKRALATINIWYANSQSMIWRLTKLPPAPRPGHDITPYDKRGWCFFEKAVSEMITPSDRVLDLGFVVEDDGTCREGGDFFDEDGRGGWVAAEDDPVGAHHPTVVKQCSSYRRFPMSPEIFNENLDACSFTNGSVQALCQCPDPCIALV